MITPLSIYNFNSVSFGYGWLGTPLDAINAPSGEFVYTVNNISPLSYLVKWDISSALTVASSTTIGGLLPDQVNNVTNGWYTNISLVNSSSALLITSNVSYNAYLIQLNSGFVSSSVARGTLPTSTANYSPGSQSCAPILSDSVVFAVSASSGCLFKYQNNAFSHGAYVPQMVGHKAKSIISTPNNTVLIGTDQATIFEINSSNQVIKQIQLLPGSSNNIVHSMSYFDNIVTASVLGLGTFTINFAGTPQILKKIENLYSTFCNSISGSMIGIGEYSISTAPNNSSKIMQFNSRGKINVLDNCTTSGNVLTDVVFKSGMIDSRSWALTYHNTNIGPLYSLHSYTTTPENLVSKSHAIIYNGQHVAGRKIVIVDNTSSSYVDSDNPIPASAVDYHVPSGKRIIEVSSYRVGDERLGEVSIYNT